MPAAIEPTTRLGAAIRARRVDAGYPNQLALAKVLGITQATVSAWESGARCPERSMMKRLNRLIGVPFAVYWEDVVSTESNGGDSSAELNAQNDELVPDGSDQRLYARPTRSTAAVAA